MDLRLVSVNACGLRSDSKRSRLLSYLKLRGGMYVVFKRLALISTSVKIYCLGVTNPIQPVLTVVPEVPLG